MYEKIARWKSLDPVMAQFPDKSPYNFLSNNPINRIDPLGSTDFDIGENNTQTIDDGYDLRVDATQEQFDNLQNTFNSSRSDYNSMIGNITRANGFVATNYTSESIDVIKYSPGVSYFDILKDPNSSGIGDEINDIYDAWSEPIDEFGSVVDGIATGMSKDKGYYNIGKGKKYYPDKFSVPSNKIGSTAHSVSEFGKKIGNYMKWAGRAKLVADIVNVYTDDNSTSTIKLEKSVGLFSSFAGGWVGTEAGATAGATFGLLFPPFGPVVFGVAGGIIGGIGGSELGEATGSAVIKYLRGE